jgi:serine phosphatase RsbU (regulator of sigma subunit)
MEMAEHAIRRCLEQAQLRRANLQHREQLERANQDLLCKIHELEHDQQAGRYVQLKMLPATPKTFGDYQFSHQLIPSLLLSGDFVDYFLVGDSHVVFFIADVSGHGSSSAFVTVLLKNMFARKRSDFNHNNDNAILSPLAMLGIANSNLMNTGIDKHATLCVGVIDLTTDQLRYSVAGHLPLPILSVNGCSEYLPGEGMPVGLFESAEFTERSLQLPENFVITLFTDGILDVVAAEGVIQQEQFLLTKLQGGFDNVGPVLQALELDDISGAPDDITVLVISKKAVETDC